MQLRDLDVDQAIAAVGELVHGCENLFAELSGPRADGRGKYMDWAERCESQTRNVFADPAVAQAVYTDRYWRIAELAVIDRQAQVIGSEIRFQADRLRALIATLQSYLHLRERPGTIVVVDTNVLLHHQRMDKVPWAEVVGRKPVRLVIPLLVLDELDDKRYMGGGEMKDRARSAIRPLDERQEQFDRWGYATLPEGTTVEHLLDDPHHRRHPNPDEEILDRAVFLGQVTKQPIRVITGDRGMRVRISARGGRVQAVVMPARFSRDQKEAKEAGRVSAEEGTHL